MRWSDSTLIRKVSCVERAIQWARRPQYVCVNWMVTMPNSIGMEIAKVTLTPSPVWCVGWCLSRTNPMYTLVRNQVYHHTSTRMICHDTNRDDLWKNCEPLCTRSERLFDTPRWKLRTSTLLILLRRFAKILAGKCPLQKYWQENVLPPINHSHVWTRQHNTRPPSSNLAECSCKFGFTKAWISHVTWRQSWWHTLWLQVARLLESHGNQLPTRAFSHPWLEEHRQQEY